MWQREREREKTSVSNKRAKTRVNFKRFDCTLREMRSLSLRAEENKNKNYNKRARPSYLIHRAHDVRALFHLFYLSLSLFVRLFVCVNE